MNDDLSDGAGFAFVGLNANFVRPLSIGGRLSVDVEPIVCHHGTRAPG